MLRQFLPPILPDQAYKGHRKKQVQIELETIEERKARAAWGEQTAAAGGALAKGSELEDGEIGLGDLISFLEPVSEPDFPLNRQHGIQHISLNQFNEHVVRNWKKVVA
jgi:hypothetical protein